jgi:hypothetical protein
MLRTLLAATLLVTATSARADGLAFDGDQPRFPHVWLQLEAAQQAALDEASAAPARPVTVPLSAAQRATLRSDADADAPWLLVVDRRTAESSCTCGAYNLAVRVGPWLAVYTRGLGDHPSPEEVARLSRAQSDPALAFAAPESEPTIRAAAPGAATPLLARVQDLLPEQRYARFLPITRGWQAVSVQHAPLAEFVEDLSDAALGLTAERQLAVHPTGASSAAWPEAGARRVEPDGTALYVIPYVLRGATGAPSRAWLVLAYRDGLLAEHSLVAEPGLVASATYAWEE